jgi:hypothetical protein
LSSCTSSARRRRRGAVGDRPETRQVALLLRDVATGRWFESVVEVAPGETVEEATRRAQLLAERWAGGDL